MSGHFDRQIKLADRRVIEKALHMESGYVLDFSDRTFRDYFHDEFGIDADGPDFSGNGTSKAKRLRAFIAKVDDRTVARVLRALWDYRDAIGYRETSAAKEEKLHADYFAIVTRLEGGKPAIDTSALEQFEPSETLEQLLQAIRRDLDAQKAEAALDRLHTYCMKRFASLVRARGGPECTEDDPLHSRVGRYVRLLQNDRNLTQITERIIKSSISVFEALNDVRNNKSFAHDNDELVDPDEARFIFESVAAILRFVKSVDTRRFEDAA